MRDPGGFLSQNLESWFYKKILSALFISHKVNISEIFINRLRSTGEFFTLIFIKCYDASSCYKRK